jgi:pimeloyl-ACP methyl ester carboxylesterase
LYISMDTAFTIDRLSRWASCLDSHDLLAANSPSQAGLMPSEQLSNTEIDMSESSIIKITHSPTDQGSLTRRQLLKIGAATTTAMAFPNIVGAVTTTSSGVTAPEGDSIVPFSVHVPQSAIDDLRLRLRHTRWPDKETVSDWSQGVPLQRAQALVVAWHDTYDWRAFEKRINAIPQFLTKIDDLDIHFIHVKSEHEDALPIILTHGWPGSFIEFLNLIKPLTDPTAFGGKPEDAFHVVIPSLPGFGFSGKPTVTGWNAAHTAEAWTELMNRLGYRRWVAQGGDWGATVTTRLGKQRPAGLAGIHLNWQFVFPTKMPATLTPEEQRAVDGATQFSTDGFGYYAEQTTRPQTIGYSLGDSPSGLATFIYEKFHAWTDNQGNAEDALRLNDMLDDISLYWFTDTGASAARFYWENKTETVSQGRVDVPVAVSVFPHEIYRAPKTWVQNAYPNLIYFNELDKGGHFAAWEQPQLFAEELRKAFASLRK